MKYKKLKNIVSRKITDGPHVSPEYVDYGIPFISGSEISNGKIILRKNTKMISEDLHNSFYKRTPTRYGDILLVKNGTIGNCAFVDVSFKFSIWVPLALIRMKKQYNSKYVFYNIVSSKTQNYLKENASDAAQPNISISTINNILIYDISLSRQSEIANFLDENCSKIDSEISLLEKKSELLEEYKQSLIFETVTKGLDKNAEMKDSGIDWIGDINSKLSLVKLKKIYKYKNGYAFSDDDFIDENNNTHLVKITNVNEINIIKSYIHVKERNQFKKFEISDDSILFALSGSIGKCCYFNKEKNTKFYLNQRVAEIKLKSGNSKYLYYIISNYYFKEQILSSTQGNVIKNLNKYDIDNLIIPYNKNKEEQLEIVNYLDFETNKINNNINLINKKIELLKEYKQSLIYEAVTGQLDIE